MICLLCENIWKLCVPCFVQRRSVRTSCCVVFRPGHLKNHYPKSRVCRRLLSRGLRRENGAGSQTLLSLWLWQALRRNISDCLATRWWSGRAVWQSFSLQGSTASVHLPTCSPGRQKRHKKNFITKDER